MSHEPLTCADVTRLIRPGVRLPVQAISRMTGRPASEIGAVVALGGIELPRIEARACSRGPSSGSPHPTYALERTAWKATAEAVARKHGFALADLTGRSRSPRIAEARQEAYAAVHETHGFSLPHIGRLFGGRDHATILFGIRAHAARKGGAE